MRFCIAARRYSTTTRRCASAIILWAGRQGQQKGSLKPSVSPNSWHSGWALPFPRGIGDELQQPPKGGVWVGSCRVGLHGSALHHKLQGGLGSPQTCREGAASPTACRHGHATPLALPGSAPLGPAPKLTCGALHTSTRAAVEDGSSPQLGRPQTRQ